MTFERCSSCFQVSFFAPLWERNSHCLVLWNQPLSDIYQHPTLKLSHRNPNCGKRQTDKRTVCTIRNSGRCVVKYSEMQPNWPHWSKDGHDFTAGGHVSLALSHCNRCPGNEGITVLSMNHGNWEWSSDCQPPPLGPWLPCGSIASRLTSDHKSWPLIMFQQELFATEIQQRGIKSSQVKSKELYNKHF